MENIELWKRKTVSLLDGLDSDQEVAHAEADDALLEYLRATGSPEVADAWDRCQTRVGGFWYA